MKPKRARGIPSIPDKPPTFKDVWQEPEEERNRYHSDDQPVKGHADLKVQCLFSVVVHKRLLLSVGQPEDQRKDKLSKGNKESPQGGTMDDGGQISLMFANRFCHGIVVSYANIYPKEGNMQNIVPYINIKLTNEGVVISISLGGNSMRYGPICR